MFGLTKTNNAFTLAEILSVLIILGVVAAITIPTTVRRQQERADRTKMLKAMSIYENFVPQFMLENGFNTSADAAIALRNANSCDFILKYFKVKRDLSDIDNDVCAFESYDGLNWVFDVMFDSALLDANEARQQNGHYLRTEVYFTPKDSDISARSVHNPDLIEKPITVNGQKIETYDSDTPMNNHTKKYVKELTFYFVTDPSTGGLFINDKNKTPWTHVPLDDKGRCAIPLSTICQNYNMWFDRNSMLPYQYTDIIKRD